MTWIILAALVGFTLGIVTMCVMKSNGPDDYEP